MSTITVSPDGVWYIVTFFENAIENSVIDEPEKGWKAIMGDLNGEQVPMRAYYRQDMYSLDYVKDKAESLKECAACQRANENHEVTTIEVPNNYRLRNQRERPTAADSMFELNRNRQEEPTRREPVRNGSDAFTDMLMKSVMSTMLTPLGQVFIAKTIGDKDMMEAAMPKNTDDALNLAADFLSSKSPKNMMFRDPDEMKKMAKALRSGTETGAKEEEKEEEAKEKTRSRANIGRTLILS